MLIVLNEQTGMSADKPRKEIIASSASELDDIEVGHGSIAYAITDATLNVYDEENEEWTEVPTSGGGSSNKFIVTLTPTAQDYSGTMDKTVAEINTAYEAGQEIWFRLYESASKYADSMATITSSNSQEPYISFETSVAVVSSNVLICMRTGVGGPSDRNTYATEVYSLTPLS